ncbi:MAG: hypothetical protein QNJ44_00010 [Rhodobacter sp.]|nr:hypothetical protein [Rhodobacter sp.]
MQLSLTNAALARALMWEFLLTAGWAPQSFRSSHCYRVVLLNGEKRSSDGLRLNPSFTDWTRGWPSGWTDPLWPATGWSRWLRRGCE